MSDKDLFEMLGVTEKPSALATPARDVFAGQVDAVNAAASTVPASEQALDLDRWAVRRGEDLATEHGDKLETLKVDSHAVADFHAAAFLPTPELVERCTDETRHQFLKDMLETPEYKSLHRDTQLNDTASELAALAFAQSYSTLIKQQDQKRERQEKQASNPGTGKAKAPIDPDPTGEMARLRAVGRALAAASREVKELTDAAEAFGMGAGPDGGTTDPKAIGRMFQRVRNSDQLKRICEAAGRFRRVAQSKQRQKQDHGLDDVVGVELGGEIGRLIPSELARLMIPELALDSLRRITERQAMQREHRSTEPVGRGPIVVVVDESGSMRGDKITTAKALALALAWIAQKQNRWVALISFAGNTTGYVQAFPPGKRDDARICEWLEHFYGGGTTLDVPIHELPFTYWPDLIKQGMPRGKTDILLITDAICHADQPMIDAFNGWRAKEKARVTTIVIQGQPGDLASVSDEIHLVPSIEVDSEAVGRVLSV